MDSQQAKVFCHLAFLTHIHYGCYYHCPSVQQAIICPWKIPLGDYLETFRKSTRVGDSDSLADH
jgi:hypothetical protein